MPIDGGVVPPSQPVFPSAFGRECMIDGAADVAPEHTEEIENDAYCSPAVLRVVAPNEKDATHNDAQQYSS